MMEHHTVNANERERSRYSELFDTKEDCVDAVLIDKSRIACEPKSVRRICQLARRFVEEEVLFVFYKDMSPHNIREKTRAKLYSPVDDQKDDDRQYLIEACRANDNECCPWCTCCDMRLFVLVSYLLLNIILFLFGFAFIAYRFKVYYYFPKFFFSFFLLFNGILIVALFASGTAGVYNYFCRQKVSLISYYYGFIGFTILITFIQMIFLNYQFALGKEMFIYVDVEYGFTVGLLLPVFVVEILGLVTNYFIQYYDAHPVPVYKIKL